MAPLKRWFAVGVALAIGVWDGCGGAIQSLAALAPSEEPERTPFLTARQHEAMVDVLRASETWDPINAALHALSALSGPLLVVAAILVAIGLSRGPLALRAACFVTAGVNLLHGVWGVIWYALLWDPWIAYLQTALPAGSRAELSAGAVETVMAVSLAIVALLGLLWFLVKAGALLLAAWAMGDPDPTKPAEAPAEGGLEWAE